MSGRPRLLQILPGAYVGGVERYGATIGTAAATAGWEVHAAFARTPENESLASAFESAGAKVHAFDQSCTGPSQLQVARVARRTLRLVRRVRPDVVQLNVPLPTFGLGQLLGCAVARAPTVVVFHSTPATRFEGGRSRPLYPRLRARAHAWVTVSEHVRGAMVASLGLSHEDLTLIHNGVAVPQRPAAAREAARAEARARVRDEFGLPTAATLGLSVGRLGPEKGHADIVAAAVQARERFPGLHFVIAGEGGERDRLERLIGARGVADSVHLAGHRTDVGRLLEAADLFLFPSRFEGSPFALLEAAAAGVPIVSADFTGARDVIADRETGLLHEPGDADGLYRCLEYALDHPEDMKAMADRVTPLPPRFTEQRMVEATLALLGDAAATRK